ncbi:hypothetical protein KY304_02815, partial [Candidatus Woesearchaeota archaeon]|nr:hypothetical protein [Candidatus Woesearchaeota archaeon]
MSICNLLKNIGIKTAIGGMIIGSFLFGEKANAENVKTPKELSPITATINNNLENKVKTSKRKAIISLSKSPLEDFDANSKVWYSVNQ